MFLSWISQLVWWFQQNPTLSPFNPRPSNDNFSFRNCSFIAVTIFVYLSTAREGQLCASYCFHVNQRKKTWVSWLSVSIIIIITVFWNILDNSLKNWKQSLNTLTFYTIIILINLLILILDSDSEKYLEFKLPYWIYLLRLFKKPFAWYSW